MDLKYDREADGYYWLSWGGDFRQCSQLFDSADEAWCAFREGRLIWSRYLCF